MPNPKEVTALSYHRQQIIQGSKVYFDTDKQYIVEYSRCRGFFRLIGHYTGNWVSLDSWSVRDRSTHWLYSNLWVRFGKWK